MEPDPLNLELLMTGPGAALAAAGDPDLNLELLMTYAACALAGACLVFVGYLVWRRFGPGHRHRRRRSRLRRYVGKS